MNSLFPEYQEITPILKLGDYMIGKYKKVEKPKEKRKRGIVNERQAIIKEFVDELNKERDVTKMKPVTGRQIGVKLGILKTNQELYEFLSECRDYKNRNGSFGKRFWGGFKQK